MAKIYCIRCGVDTGYTDTTQVEDKKRSILPKLLDEKNRMHFCESCWEYHDGDTALGLTEE